MRVKILNKEKPYKIRDYNVGDIVEVKQLTSSHFLLGKKTLYTLLKLLLNWIYLNNYLLILDTIKNY